MVAMRQIKSRLWYLCSVVCVQMLFQFAITYFIYRACGLSSYTALDIVSLQAILYLTVAYVPLPGASIASEGGFMLVFGTIFGTWAFAGMVLWRALTYLRADRIRRDHGTAGKHIIQKVEDQTGFVTENHDLKSK